MQALNRPDRRAAIMPGMDEIASDPIGAFQVISDVCLDLQHEVADLKSRLLALEARYTSDTAE